MVASIRRSRFHVSLVFCREDSQKVNVHVSKIQFKNNHTRIVSYNKENNKEQKNVLNTCHNVQLLYLRLRISALSSQHYSTLIALYKTEYDR